MSKTRKSFRYEDENDDDGIDERFLHAEKQQRYVERLIEKALKQKNVEAFVEEDVETYDDDIETYVEEEDYTSCIECGIVLVSEQDFVGSMQHFDDETQTTTWTCKNCLQDEEH